MQQSSTGSVTGRLDDFRSTSSSTAVSRGANMLSPRSQASLATTQSSSNANANNIKGRIAALEDSSNQTELNTQKLFGDIAQAHNDLMCVRGEFALKIEDVERKIVEEGRKGKALSDHRYELQQVENKRSQTHVVSLKSENRQLRTMVMDLCKRVVWLEQEVAGADLRAYRANHEQPSNDSSSGQRSASPILYEHSAAELNNPMSGFLNENQWRAFERMVATELDKASLVTSGSSGQGHSAGPSRGIDDF